jgi:hypothetical protein
MARGRRSPDEWAAIGRAAILDLLNEKFAAPWAEVEARIGRGWKEFPPVQPLQLGSARRALRTEGLIIEETSRQTPPVTTVRVPYPPGRKRELQRLLGRRRKAYRKYLSWAGDLNLCGRQAERVVLASARAAASDAGLWVPPQAVGEINEVRGVPLQRGSLDALAHILDLTNVASHASLVIEVKNIHRWIYPQAPELWELLVKAAELAINTPVLPVLACVRSAWQTGQLAKDIGFFTCQFRTQLFSPSINEQDFNDFVDEFGLDIIRHDGPLESVMSFLTKTLRLSPPPTPPEQDIPWYQRQVERFQAIAQVVLDHEALAGTLTADGRRSVFASFRASARDATDWPAVGGW